MVQRLVIVIEDDLAKDKKYLQEFLAELNEVLDNHFHHYYFFEEKK